MRQLNSRLRGLAEPDGPSRLYEELEAKAP